MYAYTFVIRLHQLRAYKFDDPFVGCESDLFAKYLKLTFLGFVSRRFVNV